MLVRCRIRQVCRFKADLILCFLKLSDVVKRVCSIDPKCRIYTLIVHQTALYCTICIYCSCFYFS